MPQQKTASGEVVCEYLKLYPSHPSKTLAQMLCEKEPKLFYSVEQARNAVRYERGNLGEQKRCFAKKFQRPNGKVTDSLELLPQPIEQLDPWQAVRVHLKKALVISDVHVPFHNLEALRVALDYGRQQKVDCIIINGDLMDFYAISFWQKDPRRRSLGDELEMGKYTLEVIRQAFPKTKIILKEGNHEERLWRYVWARCPELASVNGPDGRPMVTLSSCLDLQEYDVTTVEARKPILVGTHLYILHGHEFRASMNHNQVNPARGLYLRTKANALCGDLHQTSQHSEAGLDRVISCWSIGCLCDLHPNYMPINRWTLGFAIIELEGPAWSVENKKIIGGNVV